MRNIFSIFLFIISFTTFAQGMRNEIIQVLNEEIVEVKRLSTQIDHRNPSLLIRLAELYLEKGRHYKEIENANFIALPISKRRKINKDKFFKNSRKYFVQAQKIGLDVLKRFPQISDKTDVYYILAFNAKEFDKNKTAKKYFLLASKGKNSKSKAKIKSFAALADLYFNDRDYKRAIPNYEKSLKYNQDKWKTKDAFNLAWSYFRVRQFSKAISLMKKIYNLSRLDKFIDMRSMVERDIGLFYAEAGRIKEGIKFYQSIGQDIGKHLTKLSSHLVSQGKFTQADVVIREAYKLDLPQSDRVRVVLIGMQLYDKYFKVSNHLKFTKTAFNLWEQNKLNQTDAEFLKNQAKKMSAVLQKQVVAKTYKRVRRVRVAKAYAASEYFIILAKMEPRHKAKYHYLSGETFYAAKVYDKAYISYRSSQQAAKGAEKKFKKLGMEAMLASLGQKSLSQKFKNAHYKEAYLLYLDYDSRSERAETINLRLFKIYMDSNDIKSAEQLLQSFKKNFPDQHDNQEAMIAEIIDYYRKKKNNSKIFSWNQRIESGEFKVSNKYAQKLSELITLLQIQEVQMAARKGRKKEALEGYQTVYSKKESTKKARKSSAYNLAVLYHQLGAIEQSHKWAIRSLKLMRPSEVRRFEKSFLAISSEMFNRHDFTKSASISTSVFDKLCTQKSKNKSVFFKNSFVITLSNKDYIQAQKIIKKAEQCKVLVKYIDEAKLELVKEYISSGSIVKAQDLTFELSRKRQNRGRLIYFLGEISDHYYLKGDRKKGSMFKKRALDYYRLIKKKKMRIPLESLDVISKYKDERLDLAIKNLQSIRLKFPENTYNRLLKRKFQALDAMTSVGVDILKVGSGRGIIRSYRKMSVAYQEMVNEIRSFSPAGKSPAYLRGFKESMFKITSPILAKGEEYKKNALKEMDRYKILSLDNSHFTRKDKDFKTKYLPIVNGVLMDRMGGRK